MLVVGGVVVVADHADDDDDYDGDDKDEEVEEVEEDSGGQLRRRADLENANAVSFCCTIANAPR